MSNRFDVLGEKSKIDIVYDRGGQKFDLVLTSQLSTYKLNSCDCL